MRKILLFALSLLACQATILDRIVVTVGQQVITALQLDEEIRVTDFMNGQKLTFTVEARRTAADRLIQQLLVKRDMELSHYPLPEDQDVAKYLSQIQENHGGSAAFSSALAAYGLPEAILKQHLVLQLTTLRFIEYRFHPDLGISEGDIQAYYQNQVNSWRATHAGPAPSDFASSRQAIRQALEEARTDELLNAWLEESRRQVNIVYIDKALR